MDPQTPDHPPDWLAGLGSRPCRYYRRIGSTNDEAAAWALAGAPSGAVVLAEEQTAGRGRRGRAWVAAPETSLLVSVILRPAVSPEALPRLTLLGAVAVAEALAAEGLSPGIKWPNDVLLEGRKVAGILAEVAWSGDERSAVILGIGVNIRRGALSEAAAARFGATTVEAILGRAPDRGGLLLRLLERIDCWQARLSDEALLAAWRQYSVTLGKRVTVASGEGVVAGVAEGVDSQGALLLRTDDGSVRRLLAGDVTLHGNGL